MLAAAARIGRGVGLPMTVDAEAGYGMEPAELVAALSGDGGARAATSRTPITPPAPCATRLEHAAVAGRVRKAARDQDYGLVINARIDVFLSAVISGSEPDPGRIGVVRPS